MKTLAFDIGGTFIRSAICNENGILTEKVKFQTPKEPRKVVESLLQIIEKHYYIDNYGLSVAGSVLDNGYVWLPNVFGEDPYSLKTTLEEKTGKTFHVLDDRSAGLIGESWLGVAQGFSNCVYFIIGTGIGLGIQIDGKIIRGVNGAAGSVGWIPLGEENNFSKKVGLLESNISGYYISKNYEKFYKRKVKGAFEIFDNFEKKDENTQIFLSKIFKLFGEVLAIIINILDPGLIIMAGSVGQRWDAFKLEVEKTMRYYLSPRIQKIQILPSKLGENAQLLGIGKYTFNYFNKGVD